MPYFTTASQRGRVHYGMLPWINGVTDSPAFPERIGEASDVGMTAIGLALWRLRIKDVDVPGRWTVIDGCFVPVEDLKLVSRRVLYSIG
jgi:hypothetical protein